MNEEVQCICDGPLQAVLYGDNALVRHSRVDGGGNGCNGGERQELCLWVVLQGRGLREGPGRSKIGYSIRHITSQPT